MTAGMDDRIIDGERSPLSESPEALPELESWALDDFGDLVCVGGGEKTFS